GDQGGARGRRRRGPPGELRASGEGLPPPRGGDLSRERGPAGRPAGHGRKGIRAQGSRRRDRCRSSGCGRSLPELTSGPEEASMAKAEWDPLKELVGVQERMNKLFESALAKTNFDADGGVGAWAPVTDVYETPDQFVLCLELPGLDQKDIDLRMDGDELVVQGERRMEREQPGEQFHRVERSYGKFVRRFPIPS